jgi:hypothetical protein
MTDQQTRPKRGPSVPTEKDLERMITFRNDEIERLAALALALEEKARNLHSAAHKYRMQNVRLRHELATRRNKRRQNGVTPL